MDDERIRGDAKRIQWNDWSTSTFEKAHREDKPILLDLSAVWCHWCHVMDKTSYSDDTIIERLNNQFVPVRVDIDRRPDISDRYNMGGFPTTCFLSSDGEIIMGGTYVPLDKMKIVLDDVLDKYKSKQVESYKRHEDLPKRVDGSSIDESILWKVAGSLTESFDPICGGFGMQPKFPMTDAIDLSLLMYKMTGDRGFLRIATKTMNGISEGILDSVDGGFFRYSVTRDWTVPHYEKMLETNAGLITNFLNLSSITGDERYVQIAKSSLDYISKNLYDPLNGGFFGSQDADEEYYKLGKLERQKLPVPYIDKTVYINWSASMISTFIKSYCILGDAKYLEMARKTIEFMLETCYSINGGMSHHVKGNDIGLTGFLADNARMILALTDMVEATSKREYLVEAENLALYVMQMLGDGSDGYLDSISRDGDIGYMNKRQVSIQENAVMADALMRLSHLTDKDEYFDAAEKNLTLLLSIYDKYGVFGSRYALATAANINPIKVVIIGNGENTKNWVSNLLQSFDPRRTVVALDVENDRNLIENMNYSLVNLPVAYVCMGRTCSPPLRSSNDVIETLERFLPQKKTEVGN